MSSRRPYDRPLHRAADARQDVFAGLPRAARIYLAVVVIAGTAVFAYNLAILSFPDPWAFATLAALGVLASIAKLSLPLARSGSTISVTYAIVVAALLTIGVPETIVIAVVTGWLQCVVRVKPANPLHRILFSAAALAITVHVTGQVLEMLSQPSAGVLETVLVLGPVMATYFLVNSALIALAIALTTGQPVFALWRDDFLWSAPGYLLGGMAVGLLVLLGTGRAVWWIAACGPPLFLVYRGYASYVNRIAAEQAHVRRAAEVQLATVQALALAIEAKDQTSLRQLRLIETCVDELGRAIGLGAPEIHALHTAALLHDVGNLAVPEYILAKPGALTDEEFEKVKRHATVGAEILRSVPFPVPVAPLILSHHERWDGTGYPHRSKGEEIPLLSRVLAVADCFTALLSDRPHRAAMTIDEAVALLRRAAGGALDPSLVHVFVEDVLPRLAGRLQPPDPDVVPGEEAAAREADGDALQNIAGARREVRALYEMAQALGSSLGIAEAVAVIADTLAVHVPVSGCALFLHDPASDAFGCRHAMGRRAARVQALRGSTLQAIAGAIAEFPASDEPHPVDVLAVPFSVGGAAAGLVVFTEQPGLYSEEHRRFVQLVAERAAAALATALTFEQTRRESLTDALTGLANRRAALRHATALVENAALQGKSAAILLIDLDRFKDINDAYGHYVGDRALRAVADVLRQHVRATDVTARYGGDEFVIVLADTDGVGAHDLRRRLQLAVPARYFESQPGVRLHLQISVGLAVFPHDGEDLDHLLDAADARMYSDKIARRHAASFSDDAPLPVTVA